MSAVRYRIQPGGGGGGGWISTSMYRFIVHSCHNNKTKLVKLVNLGPGEGLQLLLPSVTSSSVEKFPNSGGNGIFRWNRRTCTYGLPKRTERKFPWKQCISSDEFLKRDSVYRLGCQWGCDVRRLAQRAETEEHVHNEVPEL